MNPFKVIKIKLSIQYSISYRNTSQYWSKGNCDFQFTRTSPHTAHRSDDEKHNLDLKSVSEENFPLTGGWQMSRGEYGHNPSAWFMERKRKERFRPGVLIFDMTLRAGARENGVCTCDSDDLEEINDPDITLLDSAWKHLKRLYRSCWNPRAWPNGLQLQHYHCPPPGPDIQQNNPPEPDGCGRSPPTNDASEQTGLIPAGYK